MIALLDVSDPADYGNSSVDAIDRSRACAQSMADLAGVRATDLLRPFAVVGPNLAVGAFFTGASPSTAKQLLLWVRCDVH